MLRIETGFEAQSTLTQKVNLCLKTCLDIRNVRSCFLVWVDDIRKPCYIRFRFLRGQLFIIPVKVPTGNTEALSSVLQGQLFHTCGHRILGILRRVEVLSSKGVDVSVGFRRICLPSGCIQKSLII